MPCSPEVRPLRDGELDRLLDLLCRVNGTDRRERYRGYVQGDGSWQPWNTLVIEVDGRLVSTLRIWDRHIHLGAVPVRMGGIGGVTTHPDDRRRGLATRLMHAAAEVMAAEGVDLGLLFSAIPQRFYRRCGWSSVPLTGFGLQWQHEPPSTVDPALPFDESRDLDGVVSLHERCNAGISGTVVRPRPAWDWAPSRARGMLPTAVVHDGGRVTGYVNLRIGDGVAQLWEVAFDDGDALSGLVQHVLAACAVAGVRQVRGQVPHRHPFVEALARRADADLEITGDGAMMALPLRPASVVERVAPAAPAGTIGELPADLLCRLLFGELSGADLPPLLRARGLDAKAIEPQRLGEWFPHRQPVVWQPDHF